MILDHITSKNNYNLNSEIYPVLEILSQTTLKNYQQVIADYLGKMNYIEFQTKVVESCLFEAHNKYLDIHFILSGKECVQVQKKQFLTQTKTYDEKDDISFYEGKAMTEFILSPGDFLICYPDDGHKVGMMVSESPDIVKKIVVKLLVI